MLVTTDADLKACVKNGAPCKWLGGYYTAEDRKVYGLTYLNVWCTFGYECGRGSCFRYTPEPEKEG